MQIVVVCGEEWEGVYVDGTLIDEDHSLDWLSILPCIFKNTDIEFKKQRVNEEELFRTGGLPSKLENC